MRNYIVTFLRFMFFKYTSVLTRVEIIHTHTHTHTHTHKYPHTNNVVLYSSGSDHVAHFEEYVFFDFFFKFATDVNLSR